MSQQWRDRLGKTQERGSGPRLWPALIVALVLATTWLTLAERSPLPGLLRLLNR